MEGSGKNRPRNGRLLPRLLEERQGTIAAILAVSVTALAGMWALSIDLGRAWNLETELQNAADAAALACASQLDQEPGAQARARLAAIGGLVQNQQTFASDGAGDNVTIAAGDIKFLVDLTTRTEATSDGEAFYCAVTASPRTVNFSFTQLVVNLGSASPRSVAVAEQTTARCRIPPVLICNPNDPDPFDAAALRGVGVTLKDSNGGGLSPGNFGLLALPNNPSYTLSTNEVRDAWARVKPKTECFQNFVVTKPGQATAIRQGLNMRFDVFFQGNHQVPPGEPPVENNPNYTPSLNSVKGLEKAGAQCSYTHPQGWNQPAQPYTGTPPANAMGFPRDACAYNGGWCDTDTGGTELGDGVWDIVTYMDLNHPGVDPSTVPDLDGVAGTSRYEVYKWELSNGTLAEAAPETPAPICHSAPVQTNPDRRVINAAVVNCSAVAGTTSVVPVAWVDLFLTEPMGVFNGNNDLYAEIMGPGDQGDDVVIRRVVRLVE